MHASPNRWVVIMTPLVFAPLAGTIAALSAKYAPGLDIEQGQLEAVFIAGATIAVAKAGLWLKGWQDYEKRQEALRPVALESADDPYTASQDHVYDDVEGGFDANYDDLDVHDSELDDPDFDDPDFDEEIEDEQRDDLLVGQER